MPWPPRPRPTPDPPPEPALPTGPTVELRVAKIAAYAAVSGAVIAVVAAILGALIAGYFTTSAADKQIAAANTQAAADFQRTQRQAAYSQLLLDEHDLELAELGVPTVAQGPKPDDGGVALRKLADIHSKVQADVGGVELLGSPAAASIASELMDAHSDVLGEAEIVYGTAAMSKKPLAVGDSHADKLFQAEAQVVKLKNQFTATARIDLGIDVPTDEHPT